MRLGRITNGISCEYEMQRVMEEWLKDHKLSFKREYRVKEVHRIADFIVLKRGKGLVNIEAKCNAFGCMMKQLDDHAKYCDYSFAFIPDYSLTPKWFKKELLEKGYGLIIFNHKANSITEVLEAHANKPKLTELRTNVINSFRKNGKA